MPKSTKTGIAIINHYEHVLILIGRKIVLTLSVLSLVLLILLIVVQENVGFIWGFITVIAVGLVDSNWILAIDMYRPFCGFIPDHWRYSALLFCVLVIMNQV